MHADMLTISPEEGRRLLSDHTTLNYHQDQWEVSYGNFYGLAAVAVLLLALSRDIALINDSLRYLQRYRSLDTSCLIHMWITLSVRFVDQLVIILFDLQFPSDFFAPFLGPRHSECETKVPGERKSFICSFLVFPIQLDIFLYR